MSITDADTSAPLATSWTEQTVVLFNAGTLATITNLVTEVESKIRRGTLSSTSIPSTTEVQRWLIRAKEELSELKNYTWTRRYAYADTTSGTYRYALPPDYNGGSISIRDITNDRMVNVWNEYWFDTKYADPSAETTSEYYVATIKNLELWLAPPPAGTYRLEVTYSRSGADNTTTDFSWLPEPERFRCCDFAISEAFSSVHMWQESQIYLAKWNEGLGKARRADGKRKWRRMRYQAISAFQEHDQMAYQHTLE